MVFSSLLFIFLFLPVFLTLYFLCPPRFRNIAALAGSIVFYCWGAPRFIIVLLSGTAVDYFISRRIYAQPPHAPARRLLLILALVLNVAVLCYFKYANFVVEQVNGLRVGLGYGSLAWSQVVLPIGISFFTFHKISYLVDVYRGRTAPADNLITCLLYILFFPQLIAGPIIRYHDIADQLTARAHTLDKFMEGLWRFILGLGKKVLIANVLAQTADAAFRLPIAHLPLSYAWLGVLSYSFQIYFDFSGYSDMAIGLGRMMGFVFPENFNRPYTAGNFTEFWQRWHISLSNWMREYLYIPLGGNRVPRPRWYLNLWIVFFLSGLWHGAAWTFIVWGIYHGFFLSLDKLFWIDTSRKLPRVMRQGINFLLVTLGWVFFRADSISYALAYLGRLFGWHGAGVTIRLLPGDLMGYHGLTAFVVAAGISFLPTFNFAGRRTAGATGAESRAPAGMVVRGVFATGLFAWSLCALANATFNPFIYFRF